jgi:hypothetical protein
MRDQHGICSSRRGHRRRFIESGPIARKEEPMPFDSHFPRSFTPASIRVNAPAAAGIYGISNARCWIFIGQADNIQAALMDHLYQSQIVNEAPTGFVFECCGTGDQPARRLRLIREYGPLIGAWHAR